MFSVCEMNAYLCAYMCIFSIFASLNVTNPVKHILLLAWRNNHLFNSWIFNPCEEILLARLSVLTLFWLGFVMESKNSSYLKMILEKTNIQEEMPFWVGLLPPNCIIFTSTSLAKIHVVKGLRSILELCDRNFLQIHVVSCVEIEWWIAISLITQ